MEVHRRLGHAGRAGGEAEQRDIVAAGRHRLETHRLVQRHAVEFGVVVGRSVEADDLLQEAAVLGAGDHFVHQPGVAERQRDLRLVDDLHQFAGAQHRHCVDHDSAGLGRGQPAGDHRRIVGRADQHAVAGLDAVALDQRMRQPAGPVREFLVGAAAAVADQRRVVAETLFHQAISQFDSGVQSFRIVEAVEQKIRPLFWRRKIVPRERIGMGGRSQHVRRSLLPEGNPRHARPTAL